MGIGGYGTLMAYRYYEKHFVPKCPLDHDQRRMSTKMEESEQVEPKKL